LNLAFYIARRYIVSKKSNNAINIISWISVSAIAVGTAALIIVLSGMNGLTGLVESLYNSFDSDIEITAAKGKSFEVNEALNKKIRAVDGVTNVGYSIEDNALLKLEDKQTIVTVKGVSKQFSAITSFDTLVFDGSYKLKQGETWYGVFGKGVAYRIGASVTDFYTPISIYSPKRGKVSSINPEDAFNEFKLYPSGLFSINDEFDYKYILVDIDLARQLFDYTNEVTSIELGCDRTMNIEKIQERLEAALGNGFVIRNRFQQNETLFKTLQTEKLLTFLILTFILVVATFNIIGALTMLIIEKKKDIAILNNMGADARLIRRIFMTEGFLITIIGATAGLVLGLGLCWLQIATGFITFDEGYVVSAYPVKVMWTDFFAILGVVLVIGFFAAWYPVRIFTNKSIQKDFAE
jgi:lipoprotein-releasing system permease protein